jgi:hypothetical protein
MSKNPLRGDDRFIPHRRIYAPPAHEPYMQSLSRSGLLESRLRRENDPSDRLNPFLLGFYARTLNSCVVDCI